MLMRTVTAFLLSAIPLWAGHSAPSFIDGCQSADGRYVITAETPNNNPKPGTPRTWKFIWKDTKTDTTRTFDALGVQGGEISAQLYMPPGGETFALWNHVTMWTDGKSKNDSAKSLPEKNDPEYRKSISFTKRLIIYSSKDGSILKEYGVTDLLKEDEWAAVMCVFNRVHWINDYAQLSYRSAPRPGYSFCRVSPDYSILEFRIVQPKEVKNRDGRTVRIRLTDGAIFSPEEKLTDKDKIPVRPFVGDDKSPEGPGHPRDFYQPSLDPVRKEGKFLPVPGSPTTPATPAVSADEPAPKGSPPKFGAAKLIKDGYAKLDTPTWSNELKALLFTDLDKGKVFKVDEKNEIGELGPGGRGRVGPNGQWYGVVNEELVVWKFGEAKPTTLVAKPSLNDIAIGEKYAYFTTLKDPEKGRLTVVDLKDGKTRVAWDAEKDGVLINPNGVALSNDGKALYVGISSYKDKKNIGVYRFPIKDDGMPDVEAGKKAKWLNAGGPDGIAVDASGHVFITVGGVVWIVNSEGKKVGELKIPKGSGTNLCFDGAGKRLFVTTNNALYVYE